MSETVSRFSATALLRAFLSCTPQACAQQTLAGIIGTVTDDSGAVTPEATVEIAGDQTKLTQSLTSTGLKTDLIDLADRRVAFGDGRPAGEYKDDAASVLARMK